MAKPNASKQKDRRGSNVISLAPDLSQRLDTVKGLAGTESKAQLARIALDWALGRLESGECVVLNGRLVAKADLAAA